MIEIMQLRAHRFQALYTLLTGAAHSGLPTPYQMPEASKTDARQTEHESQTALERRNKK